MERYLKRIYTDPKHPAAYGGVEAVFRAAKGDGKTYTRKQIQQWLNTQDAYTLHKPKRHKFPRRKFVVSGMDHQWQADLMDVSKLKQANKGVTFLLTVIDILSKMAWVEPLKDKTGMSLVKAFQTIIKKGRKPKILNTDQGTEFLNKTFQTFLRKHGIHFFTSKNETKCAVIERFNRTLRAKLWKYLTATGGSHYLTALPSLVSAYNKSWHRSIKKRPVDVTKANEGVVWNTLYGQVPMHPFKFDLHDRVRLSKLKKTFEKGYTRNWTREIFQVTGRHPTHPPVYSVSDLQGEPLEGTFYAEELQKVVWESL